MVLWEIIYYTQMFFDIFGQGHPVVPHGLEFFGFPTAHANSFVLGPAVIKHTQFPAHE